MCGSLQLVEAIGLPAQPANHQSSTHPLSSILRGHVGMAVSSLDGLFGTCPAVGALQPL